MTPTDSLFWPYLKPILEQQKTESGVAYVQMSDANGMDRMMEDSVSEDVYPGIFVYRPKWQLKRVENHILMTYFNTQFYVWCQAELNDRASQDAAFASAESILSKILEKLQHDSRLYKNHLEFDSVSAEPVVYLGVDAAYGYEVKFTLGLVSNNIYC